MALRTTRREFLRESALLTAGTALALTGKDAEAAPNRRVIVWSEGTAPRDIYPDDINHAIAEGLLGLKGWEIVVASISDEDQGLPPPVLESASALIWWGHKRHNEVKPELVERIVARVKAGQLVLIPTHSAHWSLPFKALMGTSCSWREYINDGSSVKLTVHAPQHPIAKGIKEFTLPHTERYTEPFEVPPPHEVIFDGEYTMPNGHTYQARQGLVWTVGEGRVFYFQSGHEEYPIYFDPNVRQIFRNAVQWAGTKTA